MRASTIHASTAIRTTLPTSNCVSDTPKGPLREAAMVTVSKRHLPVRTGFPPTRAYHPTAQARADTKPSRICDGLQDQWVLCQPARVAASGACFENRVDLRAILHDLPGSAEPGGNHERITGDEA